MSLHRKWPPLPALVGLTLLLALLAGQFPAASARPGPPPAGKQRPPPAPSTAQDDDDDDDFDTGMAVRVKVVEDRAAKQRAQSALRRQKQGWSVMRVVGRLHPLVVHLPIAWLLLLLGIDLGSFFFNRKAWLGFGYGLLLMSTLAAGVAIVTGLLLSAEVYSLKLQAQGLIRHHRLLTLLGGGALVAACALRAGFRNRLAGPYRWLYLSLVILSVTLITVSAHLGGRIVHGPDYLPF